VLYEDPLVTHNSLYNTLRGICAECAGPVDLNKHACLKCSAACEAEVKEEIVKALTLLDLEARKLLSGTQPVSQAELIDLTKRLCPLLKENAVHHLSFTLYAPLCASFAGFRLIQKQAFFREVESISSPVSVYSLAYALLKQSIHHFGQFSMTTFANLQTIAEVLDFYTLNELESRGPPPLQQEFNEEKLQIP